MPKKLHNLFRYIVIIILIIIAISFHSRYRMPSPSSLPEKLQRPPKQSKTFRAPFYIHIKTQQYYIQPQSDYILSGIIRHQPTYKTEETSGLTHFFASWGNLRQRAYIAALTDSKQIKEELDNLKQGDQFTLEGQIVHLSHSSGQSVSLPYNNLDIRYTQQFVYINEFKVLKKNHWWLIFNLSCIILIITLLAWYDIDALCIQKKRSTDEPDN